MTELTPIKIGELIWLRTMAPWQRRYERHRVFLADRWQRLESYRDQPRKGWRLRSLKGVKLVLYRWQHVTKIIRGWLRILYIEGK